MCIHTCTQNTCVHVCAHTYKRTCVCMYPHTSGTYTHRYRYTQSKHARICTWTHTCAHTCTNKHMYTPSLLLLLIFRVLEQMLLVLESLLQKTLNIDEMPFLCLPRHSVLPYLNPSTLFCNCLFICLVPLTKLLVYTLVVCARSTTVVPGLGQGPAQ